MAYIRGSLSRKLPLNMPAGRLRAPLPAWRAHVVPVSWRAPNGMGGWATSGRKGHRRSRRFFPRLADSRPGGSSEARLSRPCAPAGLVNLSLPAMEPPHQYTVAPDGTVYPQ